MDDHPFGSTRVVRDNDGHQARTFNTYTPNNHHYPWLVLIRFERAPFLGDDAHRPRLCRRGILARAPRRSRAFSLDLAYSPDPLVAFLFGHYPSAFSFDLRCILKLARMEFAPRRANRNRSLECHHDLNSTKRTSIVGRTKTSTLWEHADNKLSMRRGRDSNPRSPLEAQHISSVLHSTALPPLQLAQYTNCPRIVRAPYWGNGKNKDRASYSLRRDVGRGVAFYHRLSAPYLLAGSARGYHLALLYWSRVERDAIISYARASARRDTSAPARRRGVAALARVAPVVVTSSIRNM